MLILYVRVREALTESQTFCGIAIVLFFKAVFKEGILLSTHCLLLLKSFSGSCFYLVVVVLIPFSCDPPSLPRPSTSSPFCYVFQTFLFMFQGLSRRKRAKGNDHDHSNKNLSLKLVNVKAKPEESRDEGRVHKRQSEEENKGDSQNNEENKDQNHNEEQTLETQLKAGDNETSGTNETNNSPSNENNSQPGSTDHPDEQTVSDVTAVNEQSASETTTETASDVTVVNEQSASEATTETASDVTVVNEQSASETTTETASDVTVVNEQSASETTTETQSESSGQTSREEDHTETASDVTVVNEQSASETTTETQSESSGQTSRKEDHTESDNETVETEIVEVDNDQDVKIEVKIENDEDKVKEEDSKSKDEQDKAIGSSAESGDTNQASSSDNSQEPQTSHEDQTKNDNNEVKEEDSKDKDEQDKDKGSSAESGASNQAGSSDNSQEPQTSQEDQTKNDNSEIKEEVSKGKDEQDKDKGSSAESGDSNQASSSDNSQEPQTSQEDQTKNDNSEVKEEVSQGKDEQDKGSNAESGDSNQASSSDNAHEQLNIKIIDGETQTETSVIDRPLENGVVNEPEKTEEQGSGHPDEENKDQNHSDDNKPSENSNTIKIPLTEEEKEKEHPHENLKLKIVKKKPQETHEEKKKNPLEHVMLKVVKQNSTTSQVEEVIPKSHIAVKNNDEGIPEKQTDKTPEEQSLEHAEHKVINEKPETPEQKFRETGEGHIYDNSRSKAYNTTELPMKNKGENKSAKKKMDESELMEKGSKEHPLPGLKLKIVAEKKPQTTAEEDHVHHRHDNEKNEAEGRSIDNLEIKNLEDLKNLLDILFGKEETSNNTEGRKNNNDKYQTGKSSSGHPHETISLKLTQEKKAETNGEENTVNERHDGGQNIVNSPTGEGNHPNNPSNGGHTELVKDMWLKVDRNVIGNGKQENKHGAETNGGDSGNTKEDKKPENKDEEYEEDNEEEEEENEAEEDEEDNGDDKDEENTEDDEEEDDEEEEEERDEDDECDCENTDDDDDDDDEDGTDSMDHSDLSKGFDFGKLTREQEEAILRILQGGKFADNRDTDLHPNFHIAPLAGGDQRGRKPQKDKPKAKTKIFGVWKETLHGFDDDGIQDVLDKLREVKRYSDYTEDYPSSYYGEGGSQSEPMDGSYGSLHPPDPPTDTYFPCTYWVPQSRLHAPKTEFHGLGMLTQLLTTQRGTELVRDREASQRRLSN